MKYFGLALSERSRFGLSLTVEDESKGFAIIELVLVIAFLALIAAAVIMVVDPLERARQNRDQGMREDTESIVQSINIYLTRVGRLPWAQESTGSIATPQLVWTKVTSPNVGVCADKSCSQGGRLIRTQSLGEGFLSRPWLTRESDKTYIAKGRSPQDPIHICFVPEAQKTRRSTGQLYQLEEGKSIPPSGVPESCSEDVSWQDEDVCYICVAK